MPTLSPSALTITAGQSFDITVEVVPDIEESIISVECLRNPNVSTNGISFSTTSSSIEFTGNYTGPFSVNGVYVDKGESDKTEEHPIGTQVPITVYGISNIPPYEEIDLFQFNQAAQDTITVSDAFVINIVANTGTSTSNLDIIIKSSYQAGYTFLKNYFPA